MYINTHTHSHFHRQVALQIVTAEHLMYLCENNIYFKDVRAVETPPVSVFLRATYETMQLASLQLFDFTWLKMDVLSSEF